jgi:hypothetical protein
MLGFDHILIAGNDSAAANIPADGHAAFTGRDNDCACLLRLLPYSLYFPGEHGIFSQEFSQLKPKGGLDIVAVRLCGGIQHSLLSSRFGFHLRAQFCP